MWSVSRMALFAAVLASLAGLPAPGAAAPAASEGSGPRLYIPFAVNGEIPVPAAPAPVTPGVDGAALADGPRLFKSGPVQITADGRWLWVADAHANSLSRVDTVSGLSRSFRTSETPTGDNLKGVSVMENAAEVWATAHDTDRVYVLDGASGDLHAVIQLPWGCGPYGIALSPPVEGKQAWALVGCIRAESLIAIDTASRRQVVIAPVFRSPFGIAWTEPEEAWVTHLHPDGLRPHITGVSFDSGEPRVRTHLWFAAASPRDPRALTDPIAERNVAEGGYVTLRGHPARYPGEKDQLWIPTQYHNAEPNLQRESYGPQPDALTPDGARDAQADLFSPETTIQASVRRFDLRTHVLSVDDKIVLTAPHVHDPSQGERNPRWIGYGWNASVSGLVDMGFSRIGGRLYTALLAEQSDELLLMPADAPPARSTTDAEAPGLPELRLGQRPMGLAIHPTKALAYAYNSYSLDVSEVDLSDPSRPRERRRIAVAGAEPWSPIADATARRGGTLFFTSADPRISVNEKVSCATCHINGEHDGRTWAFQTLPKGTAGQGHGMRNVQSLLGLGATFDAGRRDARYGWGLLHRSGDRDEIQDFEHTMRGPIMGGTGFLGANAQPELGPPNAGRSADLDAMAHYIMNLKALPRSPYRAPDGSLSEAAVRGAAIFLGAEPAQRPADADCARCHVPETAFQDHGFHDIGRRRDNFEIGLNDAGRRGACLWCVKTVSLVGVWDTAPFDGIAGWANGTLTEVVDDFGSAGRTAPHGAVAQLSAPQRADLVAFLGSIDGSLTAGEVRALRDRTPPRIARVSVTSLSRLEVWFSEPVDRLAAADAANWSLVRQRDGQTVTVSAVAWDGQNGDRVSLFVPLAVGESYQLRVTGDISDLADQASGGVANVLIGAADANRPVVTVGDTLTITLGASGYENLTIPVHDASPVGPSVATWSNDRVQMIIADGASIPGFVRFAWQDAMQAETGLTRADRLVTASFSLVGWAGEAQDVELRRVLQAWSDPLSGADLNRNAIGAPTWRDHSHPDKPWNLPGAGKLGGSGNRVEDYDGAWDLAADPDLVVGVPVVNGPVRFAGARVTEAFRFWLEHPEQDYGYAMHLTGGHGKPFLSFRRWEELDRREGPVLTLSYRP